MAASSNADETLLQRARRTLARIAGRLRGPGGSPAPAVAGRESRASLVGLLAEVEHELIVLRVTRDRLGNEIETLAHRARAVSAYAKSVARAADGQPGGLS